MPTTNPEGVPRFWGARHPTCARLLAISMPSARSKPRHASAASEARGKKFCAEAPAPIPPAPLSVEENYWQETARPLANLLFVAPILLAYEAGVLILGADSLRNTADVWLRALLDALGFGQYFLLPLLTCSILAAWHHTTRQPWQVRPGVFSRMAVEASVFALVLLLLAQAQGQLFASTMRVWNGATLASTAPPETAAGFVGYLGAGLYEELLFRLMLLPLLAGAFRALGANESFRLFAAIVLSSVLFAAAHYQLDFHLGPWHIVTTHGDPFDMFSFVFRALAGGLFGLLFVYRGFGIAVGTHALYDILAVVF